MKNTFYTAILLCFFLTNCSKKNTYDTIEVRDYGEVFAEDHAKIKTYLETHFYNYEDFKSPTSGFDYKIVLDTIEGVNKNKKSLIDQVKTKTIEVEGVKHKYYYLVARDGSGKKPSSVDSVFVTYKGQLLNGTTFDKTQSPVWLDLATSIRGFREVLSEVKSGVFSYSNTNDGLNDDGTYNLPKNQGIGFVIMPSGLGYFNSAKSSIPSYSPIVFTFYSYLEKDADHDKDGIISIKEDINLDGNPINDDTDDDGIPNFLDPDDDNDGTPTKDEYDTPYDPASPDDADKDGVPDYLDKD